MPSHYGPEDLKAVSEKKDALFCAKARELGVPIIPGLGEALAMAKRHGVRAIAVTNAPRPAGELCIEEIKKQFDAGDIIEDLVIGAECARAKPFADPYIEGMKRLGKKPEECIVFEDSRSGIAAGKAAGVAAIVGIQSSLDDAKLRGHGATATMKDWRDLTPEMLMGLLGGIALSDSDSVSGESTDAECDAKKKTQTTTSLKEAALLLDIDGTLVLTDDIYFAVFTDLLTPYGYKVDKEFYEKNVHGKVDADVFKALMPSNYGPEELKAVSVKKDQLFCAKARELGVPIIPGLGEALAMAKQHGIRCIAVTNAPRPAGALCIEEIKKQFDAGDIIEDLVIGAECARAKPFAD